MEIACCEHPIKVWNKAEKKYQLVPCGKCNACRNKRASTWVERLKVEQSCWPYTLFFTLTYDENYVPRMFLDKNSNMYVDPLTGEFVDIDAISDNSIREYCFCHRKSTIEYPSVQDIQKFVKRLRYYFKFYINGKEYEKVRYFIAAELGPTTLRPHYHGLLFFKSKIAASKIEEILSKSWTYGFIDSSFAKDGASNYCAQYVNSIVCLPKIYRLRPFRPFTLCSKCPPIGTLCASTEEVRKLFINDIVARQKLDVKTQHLVDVSFWRVYEDALYPKVQGFSGLSHTQRVTLYGIAKFSDCDTSEEFLNWVNDIVDRYYYEQECPTWLADYLCILLFNSVSVGHTPRPTSVLKLWQTSNRVLCQSQVFNLSLDEYVSHIEEYYKKKDYSKLVQQLQFEEQLSKRYGSDKLLALFPDFYTECLDSISSHNSMSIYAVDVLSHYQCFVLKSFGIDPDRFVADRDYQRDLDLFSNPEYKVFVQRNADIFRKNVKSKKKNDYLAAHPEKRIFY